MVLMVKPATENTAKVPSRTTGMAIAGISIARQLCRNTKITSTTRITASIRVLTTSRTDSLMKSVVSLAKA